METYSDLYPEGYYVVRVLGNTIAQSRTSDSVYITLKIEVVTKTDKGSKDGIVYGGHRYVNLYTTEKTIENTKAILEAAGLTEDPIRLGVNDPNHVSLAGFEFSARCTHEEFQGKPKDKWQAAKNWNLDGNSSSSNAWADNMEAPSRAALAAFGASFGAGKKSTWVPPTSNNNSRSTRVPF